MVMMERFGSSANRVMSIMKSFQIPVRSVQPGDKLLVITDDAMDPLIWQCMVAAIAAPLCRRAADGDRGGVRRRRDRRADDDGDEQLHPGLACHAPSVRRT